MARPDPRAPKLGQESLFDGPEPTAAKNLHEVTRGRHSEAMDRSIVAAYNKGYVEDVDEGALTLLRAVGTNADEAERVHDLWALAKLLPGALDLLDRLKMNPAARVTDNDDALAELVEKMNAAAVEVDEDDDTPVHHPPV